MKFLKLFSFFRFGHRKAFKSDVTRERILISKVVEWNEDLSWQMEKKDFSKTMIWDYGLKKETFKTM